MRHDFDLLVIGSGTAAKVAAYQCSAAGWDVAVIDSQRFGGTCKLLGCDPKKLLVGVAQAVDGFNRRLGKGISGPTSQIDWASAVSFKDTFVRGVPEDTEESLQQAGIVALHGRASIADENTVTVADERLRYGHILIASGAKPIPRPL